MKKVLGLLIAFCAGSLFAGTASGILSIDDKAIELRYAYAFAFPDGPDASNLSTGVLVCSRPLPESVITAEFDIADLFEAGMRGVMIQVLPDGRTYAIVLLVRSVRDVPVSMARLEKGGIQDMHLRGTFAHQWEDPTRRFAIDVEVDTAVVPFVEEPAPTAEDAKAAENLEAVKAYFGYVEAGRAGDVESLFRRVVPDRAARFRDQLIAHTLISPSSSLYSDIMVLKATETGDTTRLRVSGKIDSLTFLGSITMQKIDGNWLLKKDYWDRRPQPR